MISVTSLLLLILATLAPIAVADAGEADGFSPFALEVMRNWELEAPEGPETDRRSVALVESHLAGPLAGRGEAVEDGEALLRRIQGLIDAVATLADDNGDLAALNQDDVLAAVRWIDALGDMSYPRLGLPPREAAAFARQLNKEMLRLFALLNDPYVEHQERLKAYREQAYASKDGEANASGFSAGGAAFLSEEERQQLAAMRAAFQVNVQTRDAFRGRVIQLLERRSRNLALSDADLRKLIAAVDPEGLHGKENLKENLPNIYEMIYDEKP